MLNGKFYYLRVLKPKSLFKFYNKIIYKWAQKI